MSETKKYFWLRLDRNFFKRHDMTYIESLPNGKEYALFYLKLLCESIDHEGNLRFSEDIPYTEEMLASITGTDKTIAENAIEVLTRLKLMEVKEDGTYFLPKVEGMTGFETEWAKKKREYRDNPRTNEGQSEDIERTNEGQKKTLSDKSKRKSNSKSNSNKDIYGEAKNVFLTAEEYQKIKEKGLTELIEELSLYMASKKKTYADHYMTILAWGRRREKDNKSDSLSGRNAKNQFNRYEQRTDYDFETIEKKLIRN